MGFIFHLQSYFFSNVTIKIFFHMDTHAEMDLAITAGVKIVQHFTDTQLLSDIHKLLKDLL